MSLPFLAIFLSIHTPLTETFIGFIVGSASLAAVVGGLISGHLSDKLGRRFLLLFFLSGIACSFLGFYLVSTEHNKAIIIVAFSVLNFISGFCLYAFTPISQALLSEITPAHLKGKIFQWRYLVVNIGAAIGPCLSILFNLTTHNDGFLISAILFVIYTAILSRLIDKKQLNHAKESVELSRRKNIQITPVLVCFLFYGFIYNICYSQLNAPLSQYLVHHFSDGAHRFAISLVVNAIAVLLFQPILYRFTKKLTYFQAFNIGSLLFIFALILLLSIAHSIIGLIIAILFTSLSEIFIFPLVIQFIDEISPVHQKGAYFGLANLRILGFFLGPILGGWILHLFGGINLFIAASLLCALSIVILFFIRKFIDIRITKEGVA